MGLKRVKCVMINKFVPFHFKIPFKHEFISELLFKHEFISE
ncbi:hypothetical protein M153_2551000122, partial [Pseudoloma neurophilia]